jgi:hypothetical protein
MKSRMRFLIAAVAVAALALPALASAHPAMYFIDAKLARPPEVQTITITGATGGTFKPSAGAPAVPYNAPAWRVQAALGADPAVGRDANGRANVLVTGNPGGPYTLTYQLASIALNVAEVAPDGSTLTPGGATAAATTNVQGGGANITFDTDPTGASMPLQRQALIANDGYVGHFTESNGLADHGWLNLRMAPGAYRAPMDSSEWLNYGPAQTSIQSHATCQNVPQLTAESAVLASQPFFGQNAVGDPFWNYVPWQKAAANVGDEPDKWIAAVQAAVGVNLNALNTVAEFRAACEALNAGSGVYVPADTPGSNPANAAVTDAVNAAVAPLNAQITTLNGQVATLTTENTNLNNQVALLTAANNTLTAEKAALQTALNTSEAARQALINRPLNVVLQSRRSSGEVVAMVTGPLSQATTVRLRITRAVARRLGISSLVLATARRQLGTAGATLVTLNPSRAADRGLARYRRAVTVTVEAVSGTLRDTAPGTLSR